RHGDGQDRRHRPSALRDGVARPFPPPRPTHGSHRTRYEHLACSVMRLASCTELAAGRRARFPGRRKIADRDARATHMQKWTTPYAGTTYSSHFFIRMVILVMMCTILPRLV